MTLPIGKRAYPGSSFPVFKSGLSKRAAGFTLTELILVAFFLSIIAGLSAPLLKNLFSALELKNTSFNISKAMNYAHEMAVIEKINHKINFDFGKGAFWITKEDRSEETPSYKNIPGRYGKIFYIPPGLNFSGKNDVVIFYPDGRSDETELVLTDKNKSGYVMRIKGFIGAVEMEEIPR